MILSIDVGLKNLSFCKVKNDNNFEIVDWQLIEIEGPTSQAIAKALDCQDTLLEGVNTVLIEKQMRNNYKMSFIAHAIEMYVFVRCLWMEMREIKIVRCPAFVRCRELGYVNGKGTKSQEYRKRKNASIEFTKRHISSEWLCFLEKHKKKDDLCDAFTQAFVFCK